MNDSETLDIAVRAWAERTGAFTKSERSRNRRSERRNEHKPRFDPPKPSNIMLVFDTETTDDAAQQLNFGFYRVYDVGVLIEEGIIYADNLEERYADGLRTLEAHVNQRMSDAVTPRIKTPKPLTLLSRTEFVDEVFYPLVYRSRAMLVGFNLPFDLTRIAIGVTSTKDRQGFTLTLSEKAGNPPIQLWIDDNKRSRMRFTARKPFGNGDRKLARFRGFFLDCRTLAFALTDTGYSLDSACQAFEVEHGKAKVAQHGIITPEYINYCRRDVLATYELSQALLHRFDQHPIALLPTQARSAASIGKAYLSAMGIIPPFEKWHGFSRERLGQSMAAYYGGRAECRIRNTIVPVVYTDFTSMYPTVNSLMDLWKYVIAKRVGIVECAHDVQTFLDSVTQDAMFTPSNWPMLACCFVELRPDGDVLPLRAEYESGGAYQIGVNKVTLKKMLWYTLADVVASKLLSGKSAEAALKTPRIQNAWRLVPEGVQDGLRTVKLNGEITVNPAKDDLFRLVIEERNRLA
ncbi:MAG: DNA polymerase, partial [Candidatus Saccharimonadales bacterium]